MIAHLRGKLLEKHPNLALVETGGIGYAVTIPVTTYSQLAEAGAEVALYTYTHVREDTLALFGFLTRDEKTLFERLIAVSGIGPRLAVTILSGLAAAELREAIQSGDVARITRIPGVGKKTGERIVLELREKMAAADGAGAAAPGAAGPPASSVERDVLSALVNLGCTQDSAQKALQKARSQGTALEFEPLFRRALDLMSR